MRAPRSFNRFTTSRKKVIPTRGRGVPTKGRGVPTRTEAKPQEEPRLPPMSREEVQENTSIRLPQADVQGTMERARELRAAEKRGQIGVVSAVDRGEARTRAESQLRGPGMRVGGVVMAQPTKTLSQQPAAPVPSQQPAVPEPSPMEQRAERILTAPMEELNGMERRQAFHARRAALAKKPEERSAAEKAYADKYAADRAREQEAVASTQGTTGGGVNVGTSQQAMTAEAGGAPGIKPGSREEGHKWMDGSDAVVEWSTLDEDPSTWSAREAYDKILAMGGGSVNLGADSDRELVDGAWQFVVRPSKQATALNALPKAVRGQVIAQMREDGLLDKFMGETSNNPLYTSWNSAIRDSVENATLAGGVPEGSLESHVLTNMLTDPDLQLEDGRQRYLKKEDGNIYERVRAPDGSIQEVPIGNPKAVAAQILTLTKAHVQGDELDVDGLRERMDPLADAIVEGYDSYVASGDTTPSMDGTDLAGASRTAEDQELAFQSQIEAAVGALQDLPEIDASEMLEQTRRTNAMENAKAMRVHMNRMARSGASPEAIQGTSAQLQQQNEIAQAQREAEITFQTQLQNYGAKREAIKTQIQVLLDLQRTAETKEQAERAAQLAADARAMDMMLQSEMQKTQMAYEMSQRSGIGGALGQIGGALGAIAAPFTGGLSMGLGATALGAIGLGEWAVRPPGEKSPPASAGRSLTVPSYSSQLKLPDFKY